MVQKSLYFCRGFLNLQTEIKNPLQKYNILLDFELLSNILGLYCEMNIFNLLNGGGALFRICLFNNFNYVSFY